jgi:cell division protein FtsB
MKKKLGISQRIGKRKDDEAAETQRALDGMHQEIERLKAENEELKKRDFIISSNRNSFM